ncbi:histidine kinase [Cryomorphaceae bacterium 1068]|nr:histidine kinase [Cryomorphaceae bacterium 1068]
MNRYLHPLAWLAFLLYYVSEDVVSDTLDSHGFYLSVTYVLSMAACFYFFYPKVWKEAIQDKNPWSLIFWVPAGVTVFILSRFFLEEVILKWLTGTGNYRDPYTVNYILDNTFRPISIILLSLVAWLLKRQSEFKANRAVLEQEKITAELAFLRSQINPHFLFNTLGFIHSRVYSADPEAAEITTELSNVLRKAFSASEEDETTVHEEMEMVENIYGIMKKRFSGKCYVDFEVDETILEKRIEPLLLMPLAENMFKHGDLRSPDNPGKIFIGSQNDQLLIKFENKIMPGDAHDGSGIGLGNTRKRLELVYPSRHLMEIQNESNRFVVELKIPIS